MSETAVATQTVEAVEAAKVPSKTDLYKQHLQAIVRNSLGVKVSKETAWNLFKDIINGTVEFTLKTDDLKLPLAGVGNFEVLKTEPRKSKAGLVETKDAEGKGTGEWVEDPNAVKWPFVPRFRFYPSVAVDRVVEHNFGLGGHADLEVKNYGLYAPAPVEEPKTEKKAEPKARKAKEVKADGGEAAPEVATNVVEATGGDTAPEIDFDAL